MKNFKNTISAVGLMAVLALGAVSANAGMILSDRATGQCTIKEVGIIEQIAGIIIVGAPALGGMILSDAPIPCDEKNGMILSDRNGMILSD